MESLGLFKGDCVRLQNSSNARTSVAVALTEQQCTDQHFLCPQIFLHNLQAKNGDSIFIEAKTTPDPYLSKIHVVPFKETVIKIGSNNISEFLNLYFCETYRPIRAGDTLMMKHNEDNIFFKIVSCEPSEEGVVAPHTIIETEG